MGNMKKLGNSVLGYFGMSLDNFKMQQNAQPFAQAKPLGFSADRPIWPMPCATVPSANFSMIFAIGVPFWAIVCV